MTHLSSSGYRPRCREGWGGTAGSCVWVPDDNTPPEREQGLELEGEVGESSGKLPFVCHSFSYKFRPVRCFRDGEDLKGKMPGSGGGGGLGCFVFVCWDTIMENHELSCVVFT